MLRARLADVDAEELLAGVAGPLAVHCTGHAGPVPPDQWVHDADVLMAIAQFTP